MHTDDGTAHGRLREMLRRADPVSDGDALTSDEASRMRGRIVAATAASPRPGAHMGWLPVVALAASVVIVAAIAVEMNWPAGRTSVPRMTTASSVARSSAPTTTPPAPAERPSMPIVTAPAPIAQPPAAAVTEAPPPAAPPRGQPARASMPGLAQAQPVVARGFSPAADERPRQLQFVTAGGTRIVWVLNQRAVF